MIFQISANFERSNFEGRKWGREVGYPLFARGEGGGLTSKGRVDEFFGGMLVISEEKGCKQFLGERGEGDGMNVSAGRR